MKLSLRHRQRVTVIRAGMGPLVTLVSNGVPYNFPGDEFSRTFLFVVCPCKLIVLTKSNSPIEDDFNGTTCLCI